MLRLAETLLPPSALSGARHILTCGSCVDSNHARSRCIISGLKASLLTGSRSTEVDRPYPCSHHASLVDVTLKGPALRSGVARKRLSEAGQKLLRS